MLVECISPGTLYPLLQQSLKGWRHSYKVQGFVKRFCALQLEHFQYLLNQLVGSGFNNIKCPNGLGKDAGVEVQAVAISDEVPIRIFAVALLLERFVTKSAVIAGK